MEPAPNKDENLSLPKGASLLCFLFSTNSCSYRVEAHQGDATGRHPLCQRDARSYHRVLCRYVSCQAHLGVCETLGSERQHTEFVHLVSSEANEICSKENKKTIAPDHVIKALTVRVMVSTTRSVVSQAALLGAWLSGVCR